MGTYPPTVQFPDLTEIEYMNDSYCGYGPSPENVKAIKTEFIFFVKALGTSENAIALGLKPVSCMNNWYNAHRCEWRKMTLYWMRNPNFVDEPQTPTRTNWGINRGHYDEYKWHPYVLDRTKLTQDSFLAASGCGFALGEPPFVKKCFYQFHTLMRMPVEVKPIEKRWLLKHNYRLLDTGKLASYWVNGWLPEEYTKEKECAYFKVNADWSKIEPKKKAVKADGIRQLASEPVQNMPIALVRNERG